MKTVSVISTSLALGLALLTSSSLLQAETDEKPMEIRKIMQGLSRDMQQVVAGTAKEDWQQVEQAASRIADHPKPPLSEKLRIVAFMGSKMADFKSHDDRTHNTAKELVSAASQQDARNVIRTFARLQSTCLDCHQNYRQTFQQHFYDQD